MARAGRPCASAGGHPVNEMILALIEKNKDATARQRDLIDYASLLIDMRYSISLIKPGCKSVRKNI
jgi:hypothetical protein